MKDKSTDANLPQFYRKNISQRQWINKIIQHGLRCHYCDKTLTMPTAVKEHLTPLCRGGKDEIENIVPACAECNQMKAWRTAEEFFPQRAALLEKRTGAGALLKPKPSKFSLEEANEPGLLKKLVREREDSSGWWKGVSA